jgi:hypothetical protein
VFIAFNINVEHILHRPHLVVQCPYRNIRTCIVQ